MIEYAWVIPVLPVISFLIILLFGGRMKEGGGHVAVAFVGMSMLLSLLTIRDVFQVGRYESEGIAWLGIEALRFGVLVDPLAAVMLFVVSFVGFLIVVYSLGYMHGDPGVQRYYAEISLFIASMLALVIANNLVFLFISWELVGLCSYLLIGYWYRKPSAASAAKKAFLVTRVGDILLLAGILVLYANFGTLNMSELFELAPAAVPATLTLASLLLFGGAVGKSAQFPLHVWLPDAMEGPTTVSALIHAATMVKAGVYLVARTYPLFTPESLFVVAWIGGITALIAATMAVVMTDLKRVIAYSTVSHLGFMTLALGVGGFAAGIFHLLNHSFFKALLFLSAGAVIHAVHSQDIRDMGGLWRRMPITGTAFFIGAWSLSGLPPWSGFWSKDEILASVYDYSTALFAVAALAALLSAVYISRLFFIVFTGKESEAVRHAHEAPRVMTVPLIILSVGALFSGFVTFAGFGEFVLGSLPEEMAEKLAHHETSSLVVLLSIALAVAGIGVTALTYFKPVISAERVRTTLKPLHSLLVHRYYLDHLYLFFATRVVRDTSTVINAVDAYFIDGVVNGVGRVTARAGELLRRIQTGVTQDYAAWLLLGASLLLILARLTGGAA
ncbi:MAG: NADH-quinone oxidoreductase subunit L [Euryarchaeota archaeon]|nr:NADH-quinone oxidoreductase subunit L [Euryarchaeota archaeon]